MAPIYHDIPDLIRRLKPVRSVYAYQPGRVADNAAAFRRHFHGKLAWAVKANPAPEIVQAVIDAGVSAFDVASLAEVAQLRAALPTTQLHFNHPVKAPEDIRAAWHEFGVRNFVADSAAEVDKIATAITPGRPDDATVLVRFIDPRKTRGSEYNFDTKFGALPDETVEILRQANELGFKTGLAFHPGSQCENPQSYIDLIRCARRIALAALSIGIRIERLNLGGGWPVDYVDSAPMPQTDYLRLVNEALTECLAEWEPRPEIIAEPGRALVANACSLITRVELRRDDHRLHINDGYYGGLIEQYFVTFRPPVTAYKQDGRLLSGGEHAAFTLFGPTCDSVDQLKHAYKLPKSIAAGDYIVFGTMGAYSNACATQFNGVPQAGFVEVEKL